MFANNSNTLGSYATVVLRDANKVSSTVLSVMKAVTALILVILALVIFVPITKERIESKCNKNKTNPCFEFQATQAVIPIITKERESKCNENQPNLCFQSWAAPAIGLGLGITTVVTNFYSSHFLETLDKDPIVWINIAALGLAMIMSLLVPCMLCVSCLCKDSIDLDTTHYCCCFKHIYRIVVVCMSILIITVSVVLLIVSIPSIIFIYYLCPIKTLVQLLAPLFFLLHKWLNFFLGMSGVVKFVQIHQQNGFRLITMKELCECISMFRRSLALMLMLITAVLFMFISFQTLQCELE